MFYLKALAALLGFIALGNALTFIFDIIFAIPVLNWIVGIAILAGFMFIAIWALFKLLEVFIEGK